MTAPMTRPITRIMWVIILAPFVMAIALPFARFDGVFGWIAYTTVIAASISLIGSALLGFIRRLTDKTNTPTS